MDSRTTVVLNQCADAIARATSALNRGDLNAARAEYAEARAKFSILSDAISQGRITGDAAATITQNAAVIEGQIARLETIARQRG
jgi:hypothetical protein